VNTLPAVVRRIDGTEEEAQAFQVGGMLSFAMADGSPAILRNGDTIAVGPFGGETTVTAVNGTDIGAKYLRAGDTVTWRGPI
jgi:hypothetical protein